MSEKGFSNRETYITYRNMFSDISASFFGGAWNDEEELAILLYRHTETAIIDSSEDGCAQDFALEFIAGVIWVEIALKMISKENYE